MNIKLIWGFTTNAELTQSVRSSQTARQDRACQGQTGRRLQSLERKARQRSAQQRRATHRHSDVFTHILLTATAAEMPANAAASKPAAAQLSSSGLCRLRCKRWVTKRWLHCKTTFEMSTIAEWLTTRVTVAVASETSWQRLTTVCILRLTRTPNCVWH